MTIEVLETDSDIVRCAKALGAIAETSTGPYVEAGLMGSNFLLDMMLCWMTPTSFSRKDDQ